MMKNAIGAYKGEDHYSFLPCLNEFDVNHYV